MVNQNNLIKCPKCQSTQLTTSKKGFSGKKAVVGAVLTGGIGILAGTIGSNKIKVNCIACGNSWLPSEYEKLSKKAVESAAVVPTPSGLSSEIKFVEEFVKQYDLYGPSSDVVKILYAKCKNIQDDLSLISDMEVTAYYELAMKQKNNMLVYLVIFIIIIALIIFSFL